MAFTAGSEGEATVDSAATATTGGGGPAEGAGPRAHARYEMATAGIQASGRALLGNMAARYTLTETYDKRTLTPPGGAPRFVTLLRRRMDHRKEQLA